MKIIAGLGNPGTAFEKTYHNAGMLALDIFLETSEPLKQYKNLFAYTSWDKNPDTILVKPMTYMNESGLAIRAAIKKFGVQPRDVIILHDDSDLLIGNSKISFARNSGGQKGVQSVIDQLGTNAFTRVRIGIRPRIERVRKKAGEFALKKITAADLNTLQALYAKIPAMLIAASIYSKPDSVS